MHESDPRLDKTISNTSSNTRKLDAEAFRALFNDRICDLPTHLYLRDPCLVGCLDAVIAPHVAADILAIKARLQTGCVPRPNLPDLRVALCNVALDGYAGSELWVSDIAKYLKSRAIACMVYSPNCGKVAQDLREAKIAVTSSPDDIAAFAPHILHVNHFESAGPLMERLRGRTIVFNMVHGLLPRPGLPGYSSVDDYGCVSIHARAKIHALTGVDWSRIKVLPNFFDERRFTQISNPSGARKALLFSSRTPSAFKDRLTAISASLGIALDHVGRGGVVSPSPEQILPNYDIVFAVGRSAIESLATGAHVILWDSGIAGPAVGMENYWECVTANFDLASNILPWTYIEDPQSSDWLRAQILKIDAEARVRTTQATRAYLSLSAAGCRLMEAYHEMVSR